MRTLLIFIMLLLPWTTQAKEPFACALKIREGEDKKVRCEKSSGNKALNAKAYAYTRHLNGAFQMKIKVCFVDDHPPNAWARSDKKVLIGRNLIRKEFEEHGNIALFGVLAHEWAHQYQFRKLDKNFQGGVLAELQADCIAGYHLGRFGTVNESEIRTFAKSLFEKGDYAFNNPTHHGTPTARLGVMMAGFEKGRAKRMDTPEIFAQCLTFARSQATSQEKDPRVPTLRKD